MRSAKYLWLASLIFCLASCKAKEENTTPVASDTTAIRQLVDSYSEAFSRSDWPAVINLLHPQAFDFIPKKEFEKALVNTFESGELQIRVNSMIIDSIYPSVHDGTKKYSLVLVRSVTEMFERAASDSTELQISLTELCEGMKQELAEDFISCEPKENKIELSSKDRMYVIYLPKEKKWFVLSKDEDSEEMVNKIIPKKVREKLGY
jgi:hypothetical protein